MLKECPYSELFWPVIYRIRTEYEEIRSIYSVRMRENTDQNNSEYGQFSRSVGNSFYLANLKTSTEILLVIFLSWWVGEGNVFPEFLEVEQNEIELSIFMNINKKETNILSIPPNNSSLLPKLCTSCNLLKTLHV